MSNTLPAPPAGQALIAAQSDQQAVLLWLSEFIDRPATLRSYRKETERFLLWLNDRNKQLQQVQREDVLDYQRFLQAPWPAERWIGPARPRQHPHWKPFTGPLQPGSIRQALTILSALFSYLSEAGYRRGNPFKLVRKRQQATTLQVERFFDQQSWQAILDAINTLPDASRRNQQQAARARWLITLLYLTGARRQEVAQAKMGDFSQRRQQWWWRVHGKGGSHADIPVSDELMAAMAAYRNSLGLSPQPEHEEDTPLACKLPGEKSQPLQAISDKAIYLICREIFQRAASQSADEAVRSRLTQASTHWLRHTAASHQLDAGIPLLMVSQNLRHASIQTTRRYLHSEEDARHAATGLHRMQEQEISQKTDAEPENSKHTDSTLP
ncbi:site-specific integrase [Aquitalea sp. LB_tupeE]|uniref:tyrosine-type recombinase/integrase n=1 Tax=Aquitalea sp. LB_tupeE TaxID=2748078 RepID=UPI0015BD3988|nr:site-specific integrase [Aquitalea sp. LB_tupeE]NWK79966.1 site-specific integrase [Aquitalea sp. LB_tupeE]